MAPPFPVVDTQPKFLDSLLNINQSDLLKGAALTAGSAVIGFMTASKPHRRFNVMTCAAVGVTAAITMGVSNTMDRFRGYRENSSLVAKYSSLTEEELAKQLIRDATPVIDLIDTPERRY